MSERYCGKSMKKMSIEELENIYGASQEVSPDGASAAVSKVTTKLLTTSKSTKLCLSAASISAISGIVSYNLDCLG